MGLYQYIYNPVSDTFDLVPSANAVNFKTAVASFSDLPPSGNTLSDARLTSDTGHLYIWDGTQWVDQGAFESIDWTAILGIPTTTPANIDAAVALANSAVQSVTGTGGQIASTGGKTPTLSLINTAVLPGTYTLTTLTVDQYGRITSAQTYSLVSSDITTALGFTPVPNSLTVNGHSLTSNITISASDITTGTLPHAQLPALLFADITSALGYTPVNQTTTVNGHALSGNVVVSASDITTGTLPHAQLPALLSGDISAALGYVPLQFLTPWVSDINASGFKLYNLAGIFDAANSRELINTIVHTGYGQTGSKPISFDDQGNTWFNQQTILNCTVVGNGSNNIYNFLGIVDPSGGYELIDLTGQGYNGASVRNAGENNQQANLAFDLSNNVFIANNLTAHGSLIGIGGLTLNAANITTDTSTGMKIGTSTTQKLGFFNATPVVQQTGNTLIALTNLGLVTSPTLSSSDVTNGLGYTPSRQAAGAYPDSNTSLLLPLNNNVTDISVYNNSVTNTSVTFSNSSPALAGTFYGVFNGTTSQLSIPMQSNMQWNQTHVTLEFFVNTSSQFGKVMWMGADTHTNWQLQRSGGFLGDILFSVVNSDTTTVQFGTQNGISLPLNQWVHVAIVKNGTTWFIFYNGVSQALNLWNGTSYSGTIPTFTGNMYIGTFGGFVGGQNFPGDMSEIRLSNVARYTSNFTPPSAPFSFSPQAGDIAGVDASGNVTDTGRIFDTDGTLTADSDAHIPTQKAIVTYVNAQGFLTAATGVSSFNTRNGAVTLISSDVTTALGYTPSHQASSPTAGDIATVDASGNVTDSGKVFDTDGTLSANSDSHIATQKAILTYFNNFLATNAALVYKGAIDLSSNPNYPAATQGWVYTVSVAGKIGGASGVQLTVGDLIICKITNAGGDQATVGTDFDTVQLALNGIVIGPSGSTNNDFATFNGTSGAVVKDSGLSLSTDGTMVADSDVLIPSQKAIVTYVASQISANQTSLNPLNFGSYQIKITSSQNSIAIGNGATLQAGSDFGQLAIGLNATVAAQPSCMAIGPGTSATGGTSIAIGHNSTCSGTGIAFGESASNTASGPYSMAFGYFALAPLANQIVFATFGSGGVGAVQLDIHSNTADFKSNLVKASGLNLPSDPGAGAVLVSNGSGNASWAALTSSQITTALTYTPSKQAPSPTAGDIASVDASGNVTDSGKVFTTDGTLNGTFSAHVLVVGGGAGGGSSLSNAPGGGGGAGGFIEQTNFSVPYSAITVTVGNGGGPSTNGQNSVFSTLTAIGGGHGGDSQANGANGGSGGGAGGYSNSTTGGIATVGEGNNGGNSASTSDGGSGGGGAGSAGQDDTFGFSHGAAGGSGLASSISGSSVTYAAGGGGGSANNGNPGGSGGSGIGGVGGGNNGAPGNGTANTGSGGGGVGGQFSQTAGTGGSGVVIISYVTANFAADGTGGTITHSGGNTIHTFTSSGTFNPPTPLTSSNSLVPTAGAVKTYADTKVASVSGTAGQISSTGGTTPVLALVATAVTPASYTYTNLTVDAFGRITAASSNTPVTSFNTRTGAITLTSGDVTTALGYTPSAVAPSPTAGDIATVDASGNVTDSGKIFDTDGTLAANSDARIATQKAGKTYADTKVSSVSGTSGRISSTGGTTPVLDLVTTAVTPGSYNYATLTVDAYGRLTSATSNTVVSSFNSRTGAVTLTSADVTTALGYTPYNGSTNPNNYIALTSLSSTATGLTYTNTTGVFSLTAGYVIPTSVQLGTYVTGVGGTATRISSTGGTTPVIDLVTTAVTAGSYTNANITVDAYGRLTAAANGTGGGGGATATRVSFTNSSLSSGVLTVTHNLGLTAPYATLVQIYDNNGNLVVADSVVQSANSFTVDLTSQGVIAGTWVVIYLG